MSANDKWMTRARQYVAIRRREGAAAAELYRDRFKRVEKLDAALEVLGNWGGQRKTTSP